MFSLLWLNNLTLTISNPVYLYIYINTLHRHIYLNIHSHLLFVLSLCSHNNHTHQWTSGQRGYPIHDCIGEPVAKAVLSCQKYEWLWTKQDKMQKIDYLEILFMVKYNIFFSRFAYIHPPSTILCSVFCVLSIIIIFLLYPYWFWLLTKHPPNFTFTSLYLWDFTAVTIAWVALSISCIVVCLPNDNRNVPLMKSSGTCIAARTGDTEWTNEWMWVNVGKL